MLALYKVVRDPVVVCVSGGVLVEGRWLALDCDVRLEAT
jgi:hypothetical protein